MASGRITVSVAIRVAHVDLIHAISDQVAALVGFDGDEILNLGLAVREAAINAIKHGNRMDPKKKVRVIFEFDDEGLSILVQDRGAGFDPGQIFSPPRGWGLTGMRERVEAVGGQLNIHSAPGNGTIVEVIVDVFDIIP